MTPLIGDGYRLDELIGRGATGEVWRAEGPDGVVAIKLLSQPFAAMSELADRLTALLSLDHPNIVRVRHVIATGGRLAVVSDLVDGEDLRDILEEEGRLAPARVAGIGAALADALAAAHSRGITHGNLKPQNVLLRDGRPEVPLLTDFGTPLPPGVRDVESAALAGRVEYLAPELFVGGGGITPEADVYGLGILLYELAAGVTPFAAENRREIMRRHLADAPPRPVHVPAPLWDAISPCLFKEPSRRPDAGTLAARLREAGPALGEEPVTAEPAKRVVAPTTATPGLLPTELIPPAGTASADPQADAVESAEPAEPGAAAEAPAPAGPLVPRVPAGRPEPAGAQDSQAPAPDTPAVPPAQPPTASVPTTPAFGTAAPAFWLDSTGENDVGEAGATDPTSQRRPRKRGAAILGAAAVLVVALGLGVATLMNGDPVSSSGTPGGENPVPDVASTTDQSPQDTGETPREDASPGGLVQQPDDRPSPTRRPSRKPAGDDADQPGAGGPATDDRKRDEPPRDDASASPEPSESGTPSRTPDPEPEPTPTQSDPGTPPPGQSDPGRP